MINIDINFDLLITYYLICIDETTYFTYLNILKNYISPINNWKKKKLSYSWKKFNSKKDNIILHNTSRKNSSQTFVLFLILINIKGIS